MIMDLMDYILFGIKMEISLVKKPTKTEKDLVN